MKLDSWNVNGIRAALKKDFMGYFDTHRPDILCVQETKAHPEQVDITWPAGYDAWWNSAVKRGYSGTLIASRVAPEEVSYGIGIEEHDQEGRVLTLHFADWSLVNVYTPNAQNELRRLPYRMAWDAAFLAYVQELEKRAPVVVCGDLNVAHQEIDLARPASNRKNPGFSDEERAGFTAMVDAGLVDTFREFETGPDHYSWWSYRAGARARNVGWRIDYFLVSEALRSQLTSAAIRPEVMGSDHCPVTVELDI